MLNHPSESIYLLAMGLLLLRNADLGEETLDRRVLSGIAVATIAAAGLAFAAPGSMPWAVGGAVVLALATVVGAGGVPGLRLARPGGNLLRRRLAEAVFVIVVAVVAAYLWRHQQGAG